MTNYTYHDFLANLGVGGAHPGGLTLSKKVLAKEQLKPSSKILDVGCGTGQTAAFLARTYGCQVIALDQHPLMLQKATERIQNERLNIQLDHGNVENMPFPTKSFDLVLAESVTVFTDLSKAIQEYARVLKTGGILLDLEMTAISSFSEKEMKDIQSLYQINQVPTEAEWRDQFDQQKFHSIEIAEEGSVSSILNEHPVSEHDWPEFNPSESIDPRLFNIWDEHQQLTERYSNKLKYCFFRMKK
jgi:ubiquinone/menaquinone biosynthesis C-methylase UbiE